MDEANSACCGETSEAEAEINGGFFPEYRHAFIQSHGAFCSYCSKAVAVTPRRVRASRANEAVVDHIKARSAGGLSVPSNLTVACNECNCSKAGASLSEFLARKGLPSRPVPTFSGIDPAGFPGQRKSRYATADQGMARIAIRVAPGDRRKLQAKAEAERLSLSAFMMRAALLAAKKLK